MKKMKFFSAALVSIALVLGACSKEDVKSNNNAQDNEPQSFKVRMTDNPGDYKALDVQITSVQAFNAQSGWVVLDSSVQSYNVLDYTNGSDVEIAYQEEADSGNYTLLKIVFEPEATLTLNENFDSIAFGGIANAVINVDWRGSNEVLIEINENVNSEQGANVLVDFDVANSIENNGDGSVDFTPVINEVENESTRVEGQVVATANAMLMLTNGNDTLTSYVDASGSFTFMGMQEGVYDLIVKPATSELEDQGQSTFTFSNVTVVEGQTTSMGQIELQ